MPYARNERMLRTIKRESVDVTPIWIMRQAGRYLPEYRAIREQAGSFMRLCQTPELAAKVTLQPLLRYPLDAAILFSDILTIPDAMGLKLSFTEGKGPAFGRKLKTLAEIEGLGVADLDKLSYVYETIRIIKGELKETLPLIGFCGSPFTVAAYVLQGESKQGFPAINELRKTSPKTLHKLLDTLAQSVILHLNAQIKAGVDVVMLFDTWGGLLDEPNYQEFSLAYLKQVTRALIRNYNNKMIPVIIFTKGGSRFLTQMTDTTCDVLGLDWEISLADARKLVGDKVALQGNLNPACLLESPNVIRREVARVLQEFGSGVGHVFNLGHGITPDVPPDHVAVLIDAVHTLSEPYHQSKEE